MTDAPHDEPFEHDHDHDHGSGAGKWLVLAIAVVAAVGLTALLVCWFRRGGAKQTIRELAEEGAVILADMAVDELLGA